MTDSDDNEHLSRIDTLWTEVHQAHRNGSSADGARRGLLERYGGAIQRYLKAATRDSTVAEELFQDFAVLFLRGGLSRADPERGRFRDYVKSILFRLVADYHRKGKRIPVLLGSDLVEPAVEPSAEQELAFLKSWRDELLARSWVAMRAFEKQSGQLSYTVLRYRADHPEASSQEMADKLSAILNKEMKAPAVRQILHRAREKFADLLLAEICHAMTAPSNDALEEELIELELLQYCQPALVRRRSER